MSADQPKAELVIGDIYEITDTELGETLVWLLGWWGPDVAECQTLDPRLPIARVRLSRTQLEAGKRVPIEEFRCRQRPPIP